MTLSASGTRWKTPKTTALRYRKEDSNPLRATTTPSNAVTATAAQAPADNARIHGEPVDPWMTSSSSTLAKPVGKITGCPSRTSATVASGVLSRSSSS